MRVHGWWHRATLIVRMRRRRVRMRWLIVGRAAHALLLMRLQTMEQIRIRRREGRRMTMREERVLVWDLVRVW